MDAEPIAVAFVLPSLSRLGGGIVTSASRLAQNLAGQAEVEVFGLADQFSGTDLSQWRPLHARAFPTRGPQAIGYSPRLGKALKKSTADLVHTHGLWVYPSLATTRTGKPYVVTPHGMLDPWALNHSRWKKKIAALVFENAHLRGAACLHALCQAEADAIRAYGLTNPICVIPNGMDLPKIAVDQVSPWSTEVGKRRKSLLYLGRLHPKKGLMNLIYAWKQAARICPRAATWRLVIAGWDQEKHEADLRRTTHELGLERDIHFAGSLFGEAKAAAYQSAEAFILPSVSEGLPMTVLEAWSYAKPVLMTPQCNLPEGFAAGAAVEVLPDVAAIAHRLTQLFTSADGEFSAMGKKGRALVERKFTWEKVSREMLAVYHWVLDQKTRPASITTN